MSGEETDSREAQYSSEDKKALDSFLRKGSEDFAEYITQPENIAMVEAATFEVRNKFKQKCIKNGLRCPIEFPVVGLTPTDDNAGNNTFAPGSMAQEAPAIIKERTKSDPPKPVESPDIEYNYLLDKAVGEKISVLDFRLVVDPDAGENHPGPWIDFCQGRDAETRKLMVNRVPATQVEIKPWQVVRYLGSVISDHQAVHTADILIGRARTGYVFDRSFIYNGKRYDRCALVEDRVHQAGLTHEKWVPKERSGGFSPGKAYARLRRIPKTDGPMYGVFGYVETDMRDLKRLFERHFLMRGDIVQDQDPALKELFRSMPLVSTEA